jgi:4'-phosphopantetheinyl transferase
MVSQLVVRAVPPFLLPGEAGTVLPALEKLLDGPERARARAMAPAAADRFLAGRIAQRLFVAELLAIPPTYLTATYSCPRCGAGPNVSHGRPGYLVDGVPAPVALSLSRADGWTLLAAVTAPGPELRLGVDVEDPARTGFDGFTGVALTAAEKRTVGHLTGSPLLAARARLWARKEAWLKMNGDGLRTAPASVDVLARPELRDLDPAESGLPAHLAAAVALSA